MSNISVALAERFPDLVLVQIVRQDVSADKPEGYFVGIENYAVDYLVPVRIVTGNRGEPAFAPDRSTERCAGAFPRAGFARFAATRPGDPRDAPSLRLGSRRPSGGAGDAFARAGAARERLTAPFPATPRRRLTAALRRWPRSRRCW